MTWSIDKAREHYNIAQWSDGYFDINAAGHIVAHPRGCRDTPGIDCHDLVNDLLAEGCRLPLLIRFADILKHRVNTLYSVFHTAKKTHDYQGDYIAAYPIKVNQQRYVVETLTSSHEQLGLEAGSKSELLAILGMVDNASPRTIICNGYKDQETIRLALIGTALGHRVLIIIEKLSELPLVLKEAKALKVTPLLGIRVRLASIAAGKWQNTGGEKSKFGLTASQVQAAIELLTAEDQLSSLVCLHCHLGSQVSNIRDIQKGMNECAHYFSELRLLGANIRYVDVGGGLGVDYEGTHSRHFCSINYAWQEYANNIVLILKTVCEQHDLPHPTIITESGRAMSAHHAMLVTHIIDVDAPHGIDISVRKEAPAIIHNMLEARQHMNARNGIEVYHELSFWMSEVHQWFNNGSATLQDRATAEQIYVSTLMQLRTLLNPSIKHHRELLDDINQKCAHKLFCNFSLFQSLPDVWAIDQIFPIMPLSQLDHPPEMRAVIQDITCDSDGRVDQYVDGAGIEQTLPLPAFDETAPYFLGFFMVGAYQEILGDMHNLFGDTDSVHVSCDENGQYHVTHRLEGHTTEEVLSYVNIDPASLLASYRQQCEQAELSSDIQKHYLGVLAQGLKGYTYFEQ